MSSIPRGIAENPVPNRENFGTAEEYEKAVLSSLESLSPSSFDSYESYALAVEEHLARLSYEKAFEYKFKLTQRVFAERSEELERERKENVCSYFDVGRTNVILPKEDSWFARMADRFAQFKIVTVIDANRNGVPDSGDTGVDNWGAQHKNIQFDGDKIGYNIAETELGPCRTSCVDRECVALGRHFEVDNLSPDSVESLCMEVANNAAVIGSNMYAGAEATAKNFSDNPAVTAGIAILISAAQAHPAGRAVTAAIGFIASAMGDAYLLTDAYDASRDAAQGKDFSPERGKYSFQVLAAVAGGAAVSRGFDPAAFLGAGARLLSRAAGVLPGLAGGMGNGATLLAASGAGGGVMVVGGAAAIDSAVAVPVAGVAGPALGGAIAGGMAMSTAVAVDRWSDPRDAEEQGYRFSNRDKKTPLRNPKGKNVKENPMVNEMMAEIKRDHGIDPKGELGKDLRRAIHDRLDGTRDMKVVRQITKEVLYEFGLL